jgi:hypothetical protein
MTIPAAKGPAKRIWNGHKGVVPPEHARGALLLEKREVLATRSVSTTVERGRFVGNDHVCPTKSGGRLKDIGGEARLHARVQKRPRQDVTGSSSEELLVGSTPRREQLALLAGGPELEGHRRFP